MLIVNNKCPSMSLLSAQDVLVVGGRPGDVVPWVGIHLPLVRHAEVVLRPGEELLERVVVRLLHDSALVRGDDPRPLHREEGVLATDVDRKSTRLNSSHVSISYAVFCLKKK